MLQQFPIPDMNRDIELNQQIFPRRIPFSCSQPRIGRGNVETLPGYSQPAAASAQPAVQQKRDPPRFRDIPCVHIFQYPNEGLRVRHHQRVVGVLKPVSVACAGAQSEAGHVGVALTGVTGVTAGLHTWGTKAGTPSAIPRCYFVSRHNTDVTTRGWE